MKQGEKGRVQIRLPVSVVAGHAGIKEYLK